MHTTIRAIARWLLYPDPRNHWTTTQRGRIRMQISNRDIARYHFWACMVANCVQNRCNIMIGTQLDQRYRDVLSSALQLALKGLCEWACCNLRWEKSVLIQSCMHQERSQVLQRVSCFSVRPFSLISTCIACSKYLIEHPLYNNVHIFISMIPTVNRTIFYALNVIEANWKLGIHSIRV